MDSVSILIVTPNYEPQICGVGDYSKKLMETLKVKPTKVSILSFNDNCENYQACENIYYLNRKKAANFAEWQKALEKIKLNNGIIWFQYVPYSYSKKGIPFFLIPIFIYLRLKNYKVGVMFHEVAIRVFQKNPAKTIVSIFQLSIAYILSLIANKRLTSTKFNAHQLRPLRFQLAPIPSNILRKDQNNQLKKTSTAKVLHIGCFANRVDIFFAEILNLITQNLNCTIHIIGNPGVNNKNVWDQFGISRNPKIEITGILALEEMAEIFDKLDIFLHLEKNDLKERGGASFKNGSLAAAITWHLPIVSVKGDMTDEALENEENILFVEESNNIRSWLSAINRVATDEGLQKKLRKGTAKLNKEIINWNFSADKYM